MLYGKNPWKAPWDYDLNRGIVTKPGESALGSS